MAFLGMHAAIADRLHTVRASALDVLTGGARGA